MALELRNIDLLALSLFDKEATYDAGPGGWLAANACSMSGYDGIAQIADGVVDDKEGVTGSEYSTEQYIVKRDWALEYAENRLKPNTLAGLASLHFGSTTPVQDGAFTAYRHKIIPMQAGDATITAATIAFVDSNPDTITDSGNGFLTAGFKAGNVITVSGSAANDGIYTIATVAAGTITLILDASLTAGAAGPAVTITALDLPSVGALYRQAGSQYEAKGIKSNTFGLKIAPPFFGLTVGLVGSGTRASDTTAFPAKISEAWFRTGRITGVWIETGANISIAATPTQGAENISSATPDNLTSRVVDFTYTHNNNLRVDDGYIAGGGDVKSTLEYGRRAGSVELKIKASSTAWATELAYYENQDAVAVELHCDMGTVVAVGGSMKWGFILVIPMLKLKPIAREVRDDYHVITYASDIFDDGTNPTTILWVYNAQSTYLA